MKKLLTGITLATALISTSAMATKARLISLGESASGSFYIEDQRDFFLNVAHIHEHGNQVFLETGSNDQTYTTSAGAIGTWQSVFAAGSGVTDFDNDPIAEGGFISVSGNTAYGVVLGHEIDSVSERRFLAIMESFDTPLVPSGAAGDADKALGMYVAQDNVIDFFYGKDNGNMKWAAGLSYSKTYNETTADDYGQTTIGGRLGMTKGDMEAYAIFGLKNESEDASGNTFEGKHGIEVGAMKHDGNRTYYLAVQSTSFETDTDENDVTIDTMKIQAFMGQKKKVSDTVDAFFKIGLVRDTKEIENGSGQAGLTDEVTDTTIPLTVAVEARVKSWLTLRGSLTQNLYGSRELADDTNSIVNSTNINAGMGLHFGDFTIDGLIGTGNNGTNGNISDSEGERGVLSTDNLMTRLSMTYKF